MSWEAKCNVSGPTGDQRIVIAWIDTEEGGYETSEIPWYPEALGSLINELQELKKKYTPEHEQLQFFNPDEL